VGKEKLLALGACADVPLRRAREKRDEARRLAADERRKMMQDWSDSPDGLPHVPTSCRLSVRRQQRLPTLVF